MEEHKMGQMDFEGGDKDIAVWQREHARYASALRALWEAVLRRKLARHIEWSFEYDHIFATRDHIRVTEPAALIPYQYPGAAAPCADAACTGEELADELEHRRQLLALRVRDQAHDRPRELAAP